MPLLFPVLHFENFLWCPLPSTRFMLSPTQPWRWGRLRSPPWQSVRSNDLDSRIWGKQEFPGSLGSALPRLSLMPPTHTHTMWGCSHTPQGVSPWTFALARFPGLKLIHSLSIYWAPTMCQSLGMLHCIRKDSCSHEAHSSLQVRETVDE